MKKILGLSILILVAVAVVPFITIGADKDDSAAASAPAADNITIQFTDDRTTQLSAAQLEVLKQSETIKNLLEDLEGTDTVPLPEINKEQFDQGFAFMELSQAGVVEDIKEAMNEMNVEKLSTLWHLFDFLDVPKLLAMTGEVLAKKAVQEVKNDSTKLDTVLSQLPETFKHDRVPPGLAQEFVGEMKPELKTTLTDHTGRVHSVAFDPTHKLLATGSHDKTVNIYDVSDINNIKEITTLKVIGSSNEIAFDSTHNLLAVGGHLPAVAGGRFIRENENAGFTTIYDVSNINNIKEITTLKVIGRANSIAFDSTHNLLAVGGRFIIREGENAGFTTIYDVSDKDKITELKTFTDSEVWVNSVAFDPEHNLLATGGDVGVDIYDVSSKSNIQKLTELEDQEPMEIASIVFDSAHNLLVIGGYVGVRDRPEYDAEVKIYDTSDKNDIKQLTTLSDLGGVSSLAIDSAHNLLAIGFDGAFGIYDISDKDKIKKLTKLSLRGESLTFVSLDPIHLLLAVGETRIGVNIYDISPLLLQKLSFEEFLRKVAERSQAPLSSRN